jgi:hypothetical protein
VQAGCRARGNVSVARWPTGAKFKFGAEEVERTPMDVHADQARLRSDPSATAIVERPVTDAQGQLFRDAYPTYADTDRIPTVDRGPGRPGPARWLRVLVVVVAIAVLAAGAALGLVKAGVIDKNGPSGTGTTQTTTAARNAATSHAASTAPLVTPVSTGSGTATYRVAIAAYSVTVTTSTGRSWVSIGTAGGHQSFAGIVNPNSAQKVVLLGPSQVDVGAGGTKVIVTSGKRTTTLTPPSAPFSYQFVVKS